MQMLPCRAQEVSGWLDEYENVAFTVATTNLKSYGRLWNNILALYFEEKCSSLHRVSETLETRYCETLCLFFL